jgi:hypothetical protein
LGYLKKGGARMFPKSFIIDFPFLNYEDLSMNKPLKGVLLGVLAGLIDIIPMIIQKLDWSANISAFIFWVVAGFVIATSNLNLKGALKGLVISSILMIPTALLIGLKEPLSLIPIYGMTLILGGALGFILEKS